MNYTRLEHNFPPLWLIILLLFVGLCVAAQTVDVRKSIYNSVYSLSLNAPVQMEWTIHSSDVGGVVRGGNGHFRQDVTHAAATARHADYSRSGYHRGHLCPAKDRSNSAASMHETFCLSNCSPQVPALNVGSWRRTEEMCRAYAVLYDSVCVLACPVYLHRDTILIGKNNIAVTHGFFKAVWIASTDSVLNAWFVFNK